MLLRESYLLKQTGLAIAVIIACAAAAFYYSNRANSVARELCRRIQHVRLLILSDAESVHKLTQLLGVNPTEVGCENESNPPTGLTHTWCLDSPMGIEADPTTRLEALAAIIEPVASRLDSIYDRFPRFIDIVYHVTPQREEGITGEFNWFRCPAKLMAKISGWNLDVSYETFWFDHPNWVKRNGP